MIQRVLGKCHVLDGFDLVCRFIKGVWVGRGDSTGKRMLISPASLTQETTNNFC